MAEDGLLLLVDLIRLLCPNYVVQLSGRNKTMSALTSEYVELTDGLYTKSKIKRRHRGFEIQEFGDSLEFTDEEKDSCPVPAFTGHKLIDVHSEFLCDKNEKNRAKYNKIFRDLAVLGYLSQLMPPVPGPLTPLHSLTPYQVPFNAVALRITHADVAPSHILYAVNASWVGLCKIVDDMKGYTRGPILLAQNPICDCLGFGICRGIDMDQRLYHILTPLPPEELKAVNCLLVGAIPIPHCIFKKQPGPEGTIPYVTTDYNFKLPGASEKIGDREKRGTYELETLPGDLARLELGAVERFSWSSALDIIEDLGGRCSHFPEDFEEASSEELKAAYRRLCMLYHPDKHRDPDLKSQAERLFNLVHQAYEGWWRARLTLTDIRFLSNLICSR
ncbi:nucleolar protein 9 [Cricetulus griseus]